MNALNERQIAYVLRETRPGSAERVLVVVMNNRRDWEIVRAQGWYRIPVKRAPRRVGADYLAFYFTGAFPEGQRHHVLYYAPIRAYRLATRAELLPGEADHPRAQDSYFKIEIGPLERLQRPIPSRKFRRITFISTSLDLLLNADEINDLWEKERRQDELWAALQSHQIEAEREVVLCETTGKLFHPVGAGSSRPYLADFVIPCPGGPLIVICDGPRSAAGPSVAGANVVYLTGDELRDTAGCVRRICSKMKGL
jgi:hypothetical protein